MFDWSGKNGDREKSGNFDVLCEWQPCLMFSTGRKSWATRGNINPNTCQDGDSTKNQGKVRGNFDEKVREILEKLS